MKDRMLNFLKWFFIVLGILFLFQILILLGVFISFNSLTKINFKPIEIKQSNIQTKEIQPIIEYVENYRKENNKYPDSVDIQIKKGEYNYKTTENSNCYEINYQYKNKKENFGACTMNSNNSSAISKVYSSYSEEK